MGSTSTKAARTLLNNRSTGVLSTLSLKLGGYPFGSAVPYCLDGEGRPVVLFSKLAEHTKNVEADNRCSLTVLASEKGDVQANARLCITGLMLALPAGEDIVREDYHRRFPESRQYVRLLDFSFYRLDPVAVRYIAGFGVIHWFEPADFFGLRFYS